MHPPEPPIRLHHWLLAIPIALALGLVPVLDIQQDTPPPQPSAEEQWQQIYASMPDSERVRGDAEAYP